MRKALTQAKKAAAIDEVPIGCVIVCDGKVIARGYNRRNIESSVLGHAELAAMKKASKKLGDWRLEGLCWLLRENPKYQPLFFSEALFLPAVKHTVVALKQDFLDVMLDKTGLDESTLTDLLTVQIMGCLEMCRKHLGKSDEEWCRFHTCFDLFLKAGYEGIIQNNNA